MWKCASWHYGLKTRKLFTRLRNKKNSYRNINIQGALRATNVNASESTHRTPLLHILIRFDAFSLFFWSFECCCERKLEIFSFFFVFVVHISPSSDSRSEIVLVKWNLRLNCTNHLAAASPLLAENEPNESTLLFCIVDETWKDLLGTCSWSSTQKLNNGLLSLDN